MNLDLDLYTATKLSQGDKILAYNGTISSEVINDILTDVEKYCNQHEISIRLRKKVYNILVESLQNLFHHCIEIVSDDTKHFPVKYSFVYLYHSQDGIMLSTGNFVQESKVSALSQKIDKINTLSQDDLKEMYKFILNHQKLSAKGGGGLGLIDIARKSGHKLTYEFLEFNKDYYFYLLNVKITEE